MRVLRKPATLFRADGHHALRLAPDPPRRVRTPAHAALATNLLLIGVTCQLPGAAMTTQSATSQRTSATEGSRSSRLCAGASPDQLAGAIRCRRRFLRFFPGGFRDDTYLAWERNYKAEAHSRWDQELGRRQFDNLLKARRFQDIATHAVRIESRTNLLFSFEKMALRDALRTRVGARTFAEGLYDLLYGHGRMATRFDRWCTTVGSLPRRQTRVLTWPVVTVFGFIAQPDRHMFLKPNVTRVAAAQYALPFHYQSQPNWNTYSELLAVATRVRHDLRDLAPRDMIDLQSFLWVQGSEEYRGRAFRAAHTTRIR